MNHRKTGRKLGRTSSHRKALFRNMVTSLFEHEQIRTTDAKAKELRGVAERMITLGKKGTLHARRQALETIRSKDVTSKVFDELAERYRERFDDLGRDAALGVDDFKQVFGDLATDGIGCDQVDDAAKLGWRHRTFGDVFLVFLEAAKQFVDHPVGRGFSITHVRDQFKVVRRIKVGRQDGGVVV